MTVKHKQGNTDSCAFLFQHSSDLNF